MHLASGYARSINSESLKLSWHRLIVTLSYHHCLINFHPHQPPSVSLPLEAGNQSLSSLLHHSTPDLPLHFLLPPAASLFFFAAAAACFSRMMAACCSFVRANSVPDCVFFFFCCKELVSDLASDPSRLMWNGEGAMTHRGVGSGLRLLTGFVALVSTSHCWFDERVLGRRGYVRRDQRALQLMAAPLRTGER